MNYAKVKRILSTKKNATIIYQRAAKTRKAFSDNIITKQSEGLVRFGVEYDNIKNVKEKRINGELPSTNNGLLWGTWKKYPYIIKHKNNIYLRCTVIPNQHFKTAYKLNGVTIEKEVLEPMLLKSELNSTENLDVFTVDIKNIIAIV